MGAKIASFLATLILSIPLAAIGLMAVFGIPQLVPANGGPGNTKETVIRGVRDAFNWGDQGDSRSAHSQAEFDDAPQFGQAPSARPEFGSSSAPNHRFDDRFASGNDTAPAFQAQANANDSVAVPSRSRFDSSPVAQRWNDLPEHGAPQPVSSAAFREEPAFAPRSEFASAPPASASPQRETVLDREAPLLTWRQASLRLTELGVKNYHLERGATEGSFLFVCIFSPADAPHIVHRFESEAEDPLMAVNQVLQQVDRWMRSRYAANNFPAKPQSFSMAPESRQR
ncbi:hypothetical protein SH661x_000890 [Planctomicrobium sp. SH661]|uniref:hypothetical protein n=1 Tax=Planctomicrobium sp. SH661 TaxID=3448124 RepID=UPI003F5BAE6B